MRAGTIGSFFGPVFVSQREQGRIVRVVSTVQPRFTTARPPIVTLKCRRCMKHFSHAPALTVHERFCKGETLVAGCSALATDSEEGGDHSGAPVLEAEDQEEEDELVQQGPAKKLRKDGKPKLSGLKEGMHRRPYTMYFKYHVAAEFKAFQLKKDQGMFSNPLLRTSALFNGLSTSNIWKWQAKIDHFRQMLMHETADVQHKKSRNGKLVAFNSKAARRMSLHGGRQSAYAAAEEELMLLFRRERKAGRRINERWFRINMVSLVRKHYGDEPADLFRASYGWLMRLAHRQGISLRRSNNHKNESVEARLGKIKRFHARLRLRLKAGGRIHPVWGRWLPENRLSVDQVPCNFREGAKATYDFVGSDRVWIAGIKADDGKRFCTLQIVARAANGREDQPRRGQPKLGIIFRGTGCRVSLEERNQWHPDIHVRFQPKAWADAAYCEAHAATEMAEATAEARAKGQESVAFFDNLHGQTTDEHEQLMLKHAKCVRHLLPTGVTSEIQLIDDGIGYAVKNEMGHALDRWLEKDDNLALWTSAQFPMWKKRVLITQLAAPAWESVCARFDFERAATRVGMRMTINGENDDQIRIQGLSDYSFCDADAQLDAQPSTSSAAGTRIDGSDPEEEAFLANEIPDDDDELDAVVADDQEDAIDSSDEDDDTALYQSAVGSAPTDPPPGYKCVEPALLVAPTPT